MITSVVLSIAIKFSVLLIIPVNTSTVLLSILRFDKNNGTNAVKHFLGTFIKEIAYLRHNTFVIFEQTTNMIFKSIENEEAAIILSK